MPYTEALALPKHFVHRIDYVNEHELRSKSNYIEVHDGAVYFSEYLCKHPPAEVPAAYNDYALKMLFEDGNNVDKACSALAAKEGNPAGPDRPMKQ